MKILIINGFNEIETSEIAKLKAYFNNETLKVVNLHDEILFHCIGCESCQNVTPGKCCLKDNINYVLKEYLSCDAAIIVCPADFGSVNSLTKNFIDRCQPLFLPCQKKENNKTVMEKRYDKYPNLAVIGCFVYADNRETDTFKATLNNSTIARISPFFVAKTLKCGEDITKVISEISEILI